jgi:hypothetical protein
MDKVPLTGQKLGEFSTLKVAAYVLFSVMKQNGIN